MAFLVAVMMITQVLKESTRRQVTPVVLQDSKRIHNYKNPLDNSVIAPP